jgi:hypothetical protein
MLTGPRPCRDLEAGWASGHAGAQFCGEVWWRVGVGVKALPFEERTSTPHGVALPLAQCLLFLRNIGGACCTQLLKHWMWRAFQMQAC